MELQYGSTRYRITVGSDVQRDGFYCELTRDQGATGVAEAFWSDVDHTFVVTCTEEAIPMSVMEVFLTESRCRVPPTDHPIETNLFLEGETTR